MKGASIFAVGGAHIDRRGQVSGRYIPGASNPGTMREDIGGGVFNALRIAVRRGASASLMSVRGGDRGGESVAAAIAAEGIADCSAVFLDRSTPSYTALIDEAGEVIAGLADTGLYELAFAKQIKRAKVREAIAASDGVLCDANLPALALERLVTVADAKPIFAIAISPAKAVRLAGVLDRLVCLYMNRREATALAEIASDAPAWEIVSRLREKGLASGALTQGGEAVIGFDTGGMFALHPPAPGQIADATGAGDALAGATTVALLKGMPLREALREGAAAATLAIESGVAVPELAANDFAAALALVPEAVEMA